MKMFQWQMYNETVINLFKVDVLLDYISTPTVQKKVANESMNQHFMKYLQNPFPDRVVRFHIHFAK